MKPCRNCKEPFDTRFKTTEKYCWKEVCKQVEIKLYFEEKRKKDDKKWKTEKQAIKDKNGWNTKKPPKNVLQDEINKLARMIDNRFNKPCISCGNTNDVKYDGGHRISVAACISIRYNLHDIRKQCSKHCNVSLSGNPDGYDKGLKETFGLKYKNYVKYELRKIYSYVDLGSIDYTEKIKLVRKLNRTFDTFRLSDPISARFMLNRLIGIYKSDLGLIDFESKEDDPNNQLF